MVMPVMPGDRAFQEIKNIAPHMKVIMSSGFKADRRVIRTLKEGACDFIQKPYGYKSLYDVCFKTLNLK
jgi:FixJ family two-component response regulator